MVPTFIKWAGGKRQLLGEIDRRLPDRVEVYFEPFLGGGAVFFHVAKRFSPRAVLADANSELINAFQVVRDRPRELIALLKEHAGKHSRTHYYRIRDLEPEDPVERAARFIYLNRTCFNGLYRVNREGKFNVPIGRVRGSIVQAEKILEASALLRGTRLVVSDFRDFLRDVREGFVYLDPPYHLPGGFTGYTSGGFSDRDQEDLARAFRMLDRRGVLLMLSNSDTPLIRDLYEGFNLHGVRARRSINRDGSGRGPVGELIITNY